MKRKNLDKIIHESIKTMITETAKINLMFVDVIKKVNAWFKKPTLMPGRIGTNQESALNEWEACNS